MNFFHHFFIGFIGLAVLGALLNWFANPYGIYNPPFIKNLNSEKSAGAPRFFKPLQVSSLQPDVVILGSSRAQVGLDPSTLPNTYNLGIPGLTASELLGYGEHVLTDTKATRLIIGLDFFTFDDAQTVSGSYELAVLGKNTLFRAIPETLFSFNTLNLSRKTFRNSYKRKSSLHLSNGLYQLPLPSGHLPEDLILETVNLFTSPGGGYRGQKQFKKSLSKLGNLLEMANLKGVTVELFISPTHVALVEALDVVKLWNVYENWKRQLTHLAATQKVILWDFSGYTKLTTVSLANSQTVFFEGSHYLPSIGRQLLTIINKNIENKNIGQRLTPENIIEFLNSQRGARIKYRLNNAEDVERIRDVVCKNICN